MNDRPADRYTSRRNWCTFAMNSGSAVRASQPALRAFGDGSPTLLRARNGRPAHRGNSSAIAQTPYNCY
jgi:hypothetical protein